MTNKRKTETIVDCINEFAVAGLIIASYYLRETINKTKDAAKKK